MLKIPRGLLLALVLLVVCGLALAQANPQQAQKEKEAEVLFNNGEARMKVASYDEAIEQFTNVLKRYPDTQTRYKAQFRMADALVALKKEADAIKLLQTVVNEESADWSPQALMHIGEIYGNQQKYAEAFRAYRQIIADYPNNPTVDHAYFAIGVTHFQLGHYEQAARELDKVGTVYAATEVKLQHVSPGDPLYVRLTEPNMVATNATKIPVTLATLSGDKEQLSIGAEVEGGDHFVGVINTMLGTVKPGDGTLQLHGNDIVTMTYQSRYIGEGAEPREVPMSIASNGRVMIRDSQGNEVKGVVISDTMIIEVNDADRDTTDGADTLKVELKSRKKDSETLTLTETGEHTGIFQVKIPLERGEPKPESAKVETNAGLAEGSVTQLDDLITISYLDDKHLSVLEGETRTVKQSASIFEATNAKMTPVEHDIPRADLEIKALLYKGRSLTQIAATYRDLGQPALGTITFRKAAEQFQAIINKYRTSPEVEDALYGLFEIYVEQGSYDYAIGIVNRITRQFPQSTRASEALFQLADIHVKREEYDRALGIYSNLANSAKGTPLAEKAQYAVCTTYMEMFKPKASMGSDRPVVTREQVTASLDAFARNYPASEQAPEALWQLVRFRYDGEDYRGTVDTARRMVALYADSVMAGRVLLMMGQAQYKLRDIEGAKMTFANIIANYGEQADPAAKILNELEKRTAPAKPAAGN
ncbi:MAG: tetratricopeptide repeat protein [Armatimonadota bacterium]